MVKVVHEGVTKRNSTGLGILKNLYLQSYICKYNRLYNNVLNGRYNEIDDKL